MSWLRIGVMGLIALAAGAAALLLDSPCWAPVSLDAGLEHDDRNSAVAVAASRARIDFMRPPYRIPRWGIRFGLVG